MKDYLVRILAEDAGVRGIICATSNTVNEANRRHQTAPTAAHVLKLGLTGGVLFGSLLRKGQRLALKFEGGGPLQKMVVEANSLGEVRGYVANPYVDLPKVGGHYDVARSLGKAGLLTVVKDLQLPEMVNSVIPLETSTIDGDLMAHMLHSEQIPTYIQIGAATYHPDAGEVTGGILIQSFPPYGADEVKAVVNKLGELPPIDAILASGKTLEDVTELIFGAVDSLIFESRPVQFKCDCSRERSERALISLGPNELRSLIEDNEPVSIDCHFCHQKYIFDQQQLEMLLNEME